MTEGENPPIIGGGCSHKQLFARCRVRNGQHAAGFAHGVENTAIRHDRVDHAPVTIHVTRWGLVPQDPAFCLLGQKELARVWQFDLQQGGTRQGGNRKGGKNTIPMQGTGIHGFGIVHHNHKAVATTEGGQPHAGGNGNKHTVDRRRGHGWHTTAIPPGNRARGIRLPGLLPRLVPTLGRGCRCGRGQGHVQHGRGPWRGQPLKQVSRGGIGVHWCRGSRCGASGGRGHTSRSRSGTCRCRTWHPGSRSGRFGLLGAVGMGAARCIGHGCHGGAGQKQGNGKKAASHANGSAEIHVSLILNEQ